MRAFSIAAGSGVFLGMVVLLAPPVGAQEGARASSPPPDSVGAIEEAYQRQLLDLDRRRVGQLADLAGRQKPADAAATYEHLFRIAVAGNLFREAEPAAAAVVRDGSPSPAATALAYLVKIVAESDRGAFDASLATLSSALDQSPRTRGEQPALLTSEVVSLCDAYYQRLVRAGRYDLARKALGLTLEKVKEPTLRAFLEGRLKRVDLVGKPAPAVRGKDFDGKPFDLAKNGRGKVVLVVFWATWCPPCGDDVEWLKETVRAYHPQGLQVVGINVDALRDGGGRAELVRPAVRRFLLDHNVTWPTLLNGTGEADHAGAFGVTDIPANVLIAKDGTVAHVDLVRDQLDDAIARELAK
jgi:peroxiredoxin